MARALLAGVVLVLLPGCSYLLPSSNQPPTAHINAITPFEATQGDVVRFSGSGTDADGQVVAYRWRSDRNGQLGSTAEFETSSLSLGDHVIFFMVQDNNGAWSAEVQGAMAVAPASPVPAEIVSFAPSLATITAGESATLSWSVVNATAVFIDQGIGAVTPTGSIRVTPVATTTYTLTAMGDDSIATAIVTITVQPARGMTLIADVEASGYVRSSGTGTTEYVYVGDDANNRAIQGFVTIDISHIPDDAVIVSAVLDLSDYEIPDESPFPQLGCLGAYMHDYYRLEGSDYWSRDVPSPVEEWCSIDDVNAPVDSFGIRNALQARVGESWFQFRLQFADRATDSDDVGDHLRWTPEHPPKMIVEYTTHAD